jgi:hypothetical protein
VSIVVAACTDPCGTPAGASRFTTVAPDITPSRICGNHGVALPPCTVPCSRTSAVVCPAGSVNTFRRFTVSSAVIASAAAVDLLTATAGSYAFVASSVTGSGLLPALAHVLADLHALTLPTVAASLRADRVGLGELVAVLAARLVLVVHGVGCCAAQPALSIARQLASTYRALARPSRVDLVIGMLSRAARLARVLDACPATTDVDGVFRRLQVIRADTSTVPTSRTTPARLVPVVALVVKLLVGRQRPDELSVDVPVRAVVDMPALLPGVVLAVSLSVEAACPGPATVRLDVLATPPIRS